MKHPHVCGEDNFGYIFDLCNPETPPRVWGRPRLRFASLIFARNTPTCVGKTFTLLLLKVFARKHPHVCGEDPHAFNRLIANAETPTRVWGRR